MAIIGSSLDPQQQNLDMLNTLGSVVSSNVDIKKSIDTLRATILDASNKEQTESARLRASINRSVNSIAEYFRGQISADLIQKSDTQSRASSVLGRSAGTKITSNAKAADKEVTKLSADAKETSKNMMEASRNFTGSIKELIAVIGNRNFFSNSSSIDKFVEDIKNGKITGLNTFSKGIGINPKTLNKDIVVPLIHGIIKEIKTGQDFQTAVKNATLVENKKIESTDNESSINEDSLQENVKAIRDGLLFMTKRYKSIDKSDLWKSEKNKKGGKTGVIDDAVGTALGIAFSKAIGKLGTVSIAAATVYLAYSAISDIRKAKKVLDSADEEAADEKNRSMKSIKEFPIGDKEVRSPDTSKNLKTIEDSGGFDTSKLKEIMSDKEILNAYKLSLINRYRALTAKLLKKYDSATGSNGHTASITNTIMRDNNNEIKAKIFMSFHKALHKITCENNGGLENAMTAARKVYLITIEKTAIAFFVMTKNENCDKSFDTIEEKEDYISGVSAEAIKPINASEASNFDASTVRNISNRLVYDSKMTKKKYKSGNEPRKILLDEEGSVIYNKYNEQTGMQRQESIMRQEIGNVLAVMRTAVGEGWLWGDKMFNNPLMNKEYLDKRNKRLNTPVDTTKFNQYEVKEEDDVLYGSGIRDNRVKAYQRGLQITSFPKQSQDNNTSQTGGFANPDKLINNLKQEAADRVNATNKQNAELLKYLSINTAEQKTTNKLLEQLIDKPTVIAPGPRRSALPTIMNNSLNGGIQ